MGQPRQLEGALTVTLVFDVSPFSPSASFIELLGHQSMEKSLTIFEEPSRPGVERQHHRSELAYSS